MSVTPVQVLIKRPGESRMFSWDFSNLLDAGETLVGTPAVTAVAQGLVAGSLALGLSGAASITSPLAFQRIAGGSDGEDYVCHAVCATSTGNVLQADGVLQVREFARGAV